MAAAAAQFRAEIDAGRVTFALADEQEHAKLLPMFGLEDTDAEVSLIAFGLDERKYRLEIDSGDDNEAFTVENIARFTKEVISRKRKAFLLSRPVPAKQGVVTELVGSTFEKVVLNPAKNVLVLVYSPTYV
jgi:hypothetical protein